MIYKMSTGHGVALVSLTALSPQPKQDPVAPVDREFSVSGTVTDLGYFTCFHYEMLLSESEYLSVLTQWGINLLLSCSVTIYCRDQRMQAKRYNGTVLLPEMGQDAKYDAYFPRNIALYVVDLEELS